MDLREPDRAELVDLGRTTLRLWCWGDPAERHEVVAGTGHVEVDAADHAQIVAVVQGWWADCR